MAGKQAQGWRGDPIWEIWNGRIREDHGVPTRNSIASEIGQIRLRLNAEEGVELTVRIGEILRENRISEVLTELCARRSCSAVMSGLSAQEARRS